MAETSLLQQAYEKLDAARDEINTLLASDPKFSHFTNMINNQLTALSNHLRARSGDQLTVTARRRFEPIKPVQQAAPAEPVEVKSPQELATEELTNDVNALYEGFATRDTSEILDSVDELQIRGVAKMAGMQVTETNPERIDAAFVDSVKEAITTQKNVSTLTTNPDDASAKEREAIQAELSQIEKDRDEVEKVLNKSRSAARKNELLEKLSALDTRKGELTDKLNQLSA